MMSVRAVDFLSGWIDRRLQHAAALRCDEQLGQECLAAAEAAGIRVEELGGCPRLLAGIIAEHLSNWSDGARPTRQPREDCDDRPEVYVVGLSERVGLAVRGRHALIGEAA